MDPRRPQGSQDAPGRGAGVGAGGGGSQARLGRRGVRGRRGGGWSRPAPKEGRGGDRALEPAASPTQGLRAAGPGLPTGLRDPMSAARRLTRGRWKGSRNGAGLAVAARTRDARAGNGTTGLACTGAGGRSQTLSHPPPPSGPHSPPAAPSSSLGPLPLNAPGPPPSPHLLLGPLAPIPSRSPSHPRVLPPQRPTPSSIPAHPPPVPPPWSTAPSDPTPAASHLVTSRSQSGPATAPGVTLLPRPQLERHPLP